MILEKDEREEFLRRENELQDLLTEKETQAANAERSLMEAREELKSYKDGAARAAKENESMADKLNKSQLELQKLSYQGKEDSITMESLKDANSELEAELISVKQQLLELKMSAKETTAALDEKDRKKKEKMAKMMAGFDLGDTAFSDNENRMRDMLDQVDSLHAASLNGESVPSHVLEDLRAKLLESQTLVRQAEKSLSDRAEDDHEDRTIALEERLSALQQDYEDLLTKNLGTEDVQDVKGRLEQLYTDRHETQNELVHDLRDQLTHKSQEIEKLQKSIGDLQSRSGANGAVANGISSKTLQQQITDFESMKKNLMRDLQNRCERVVELEISLDETREQYNNVLRSSNNRQQQKKMAFLERNLDQLTAVQRQLVDQNTSLKKEVAIAERKLIARNERILSLESLLSDSQDKLTAANHRYVHCRNSRCLTDLSLLDSRHNLPQSRRGSKLPKSPQETWLLVAQVPSAAWVVS
jgi:kinesin family member 5